MAGSTLLLDLLKDLQERTEEQKEAAKTSNNQEERIKAAKDSTKSALFALLSAISQAPKDVLTPEARQKIDAELMEQTNAGTAVLKFPLLRALQAPCHYRAFLGLPQTLEQTRRFMTQISAAKLRDILGGGDGLDLSNVTDIQELAWVEKVLHFMTGDDRRKKELGGFVLQDKSVVRGAINRAAQRRKDLEKAAKQAVISARKPVKVQYELERDVRLVDQERQQARASDFGSMIDDALKK